MFKDGIKKQKVTRALKAFAGVKSIAHNLKGKITMTFASLSIVGRVHHTLLQPASPLPAARVWRHLPCRMVSLNLGRCVLELRPLLSPPQELASAKAVTLITHTARGKLPVSVDDYSLTAKGGWGMIRKVGKKPGLPAVVDHKVP